MGSTRSTTLVLVGTESAAAIGALSRLKNVRVTSFTGDAGVGGGVTDEDVERWVSQSDAPYVVHDRDPLGHVAAAWVEFFDDLSTLGTLDLEVDRVVASLERGILSLPDYYIVLEPESLAPTWKHWWLGVLPQAAPTRVIPFTEGRTPLSRVLGQLPTGRAWPKPEPWLHDVARSVPDRIGLEPREGGHPESP
ncbi:hypothetical protein [Subtercola boreus]|uniref:Uncharacterized protein n=1 Tax=Subtercola boreus TaxID=120213 RepID=A0A3E0W874_9MICO|nr:hypothetical protein [Subtercola boreus]RFA19021.1 hypothetical protein B7R24_12845 [Subtercola boreus]RFA19159.1 hypothetical protein B7R23_12825 [Subtercola boreus]RFA25621.1 hypothetical protein B7R25_12945 [Subtercola boreus]